MGILDRIKNEEGELIVKQEKVDLSIQDKLYAKVLGSISYVYIKGLYLHLSMNATLATAGQNTITIDVGTTVIFQDIVYIPATAITVPEYRVQIDNFEYVSTVANLAVTVNITTALASGVLSAAIKGGYTTLALGQ